MINRISDLILHRSRKEENADLAWLHPDAIDRWDNWWQAIRYGLGNGCMGHGGVAGMRMAKLLRDGHVILRDPKVDYWPDGEKVKYVTWGIGNGFQLWVFVSYRVKVCLSVETSRETYGLFEPHRRTVFELEDYGWGPAHLLHEQVFAQVRADPELVGLNWGTI